MINLCSREIVDVIKAFRESKREPLDAVEAIIEIEEIFVQYGVIEQEEELNG